MTTTDLEAEADRIAALRNDSRTPAIVRRALLSPGALTLRRYLALEEAGSPLLSGAWPWEDAGAMARHFLAAWDILFPDRPLPEAAEIARGIGEMAAEVQRGFSTLMPMRWPRTGSAQPVQEPPDGLGWVARFLARFSYPLDITLDMPLDQLFILSAGMSANEGAECAGEDYRDRGLRIADCGLDEGRGEEEQDRQEKQECGEEHEETMT